MIQIILGIAMLIAVGTVLRGIRVMKTKKPGNLKYEIFTSVGLFAVAIIAFVGVGINQTLLAATVNATGDVAASGISLGEGLKYLAAALSTGLATIGTGVAVGSTGSSAIGAVSEDPGIFTKALIFVGMAEGIAIYGLIISILILYV